MAEFIDGTVMFTPKPKVVKTTFTHYLNCEGNVVQMNATTAGSDYEHVLYLGTYVCKNVEMDLFKAWDKDFNSAALYLGIKGNEEYKSM